MSIIEMLLDIRGGVKKKWYFWVVPTTKWAEKCEYGLSGYPLLGARRAPNFFRGLKTGVEGP